MASMHLHQSLVFIFIKKLNIGCQHLHHGKPATWNFSSPRQDIGPLPPPTVHSLKWGCKKQCENPSHVCKFLFFHSPFFNHFFLFQANLQSVMLHPTYQISPHCHCHPLACIIREWQCKNNHEKPLCIFDLTILSITIIYNFSVFRANMQSMTSQSMNWILPHRHRWLLVYIQKTKWQKGWQENIAFLGYSISCALHCFNKIVFLVWKWDPWYHSPLTQCSPATTATCLCSLQCNHGALRWQHFSTMDTYIMAPFIDSALWQWHPPMTVPFDNGTLWQCCSLKTVLFDNGRPSPSMTVPLNGEKS